MTATFDPTLAQAKDKVRQRIGDVDPPRAQVQDETIDAYLAEGRSVLQTAHRLCLDLAARYAPVGDITLDGQRSRFETIYKHYIDLAGAILNEMAKATPASSSTPGMIVGGLTDTRGPLERNNRTPDWAWDY